VLLSPDGKVNALIVGVGGFLGMGEKHVALPFNAVKHTAKDGNEGCKKVWSEKVSGTSRNGRKELEALLDYVREGDTWSALA
jgi:PRC-barrel domain